MPNEEILERERERVRVEYEQAPVFFSSIFKKSLTDYIYISVKINYAPLGNDTGLPFL